MDEKKITGFDYLWCALYACAGFLLEVILVLIEGAIGIDINSFTPFQNIVHWLITTTAWIIAGLVVTFIGKRTTGFDIWETKAKLKAWQYAAIALCFIVNIAATYLDWGGFKILLELKANGTVLFIFQYIYYIAEGFLMSLVIVFAQKACEIWFKNEKIPFGGIILGLTWGLGHIFTKGSIMIGIMSAFGGFLFGTVYLFVNKDYRKALPIITLLFML